jgi:hypothetical protein
MVTGQLPVVRALFCLRSVCVAVVAGLVAACSSPSAPAGTSGTASAAPIGVTSTLAGQSSPPLRVPWEALPSVPAAQVSEVDFLIDGRLGWVERKAPYVYGNDGNWLVTSFLTPGQHAFTVRVITAAGHSATSTVNAMVAAPPAPPPGLAGTWARAVTPDDVKKASSGSPPPAGDWKLTIAPVGWEPIDPQGNRGLFDVRYQSAAAVEMRPTIEQPPFPNSNNGGFCADTDPMSTWAVVIGARGKTLSLHPAGHDPCGDRAAVLEGVWTLVTT